jgi:hypothetical protein
MRGKRWFGERREREGYGTEQCQVGTVYELIKMVISTNCRVSHKAGESSLKPAKHQGHSVASKFRVLRLRQIVNKS